MSFEQNLLIKLRDIEESYEETCLQIDDEELLRIGKIAVLGVIANIQFSDNEAGIYGKKYRPVPLSTSDKFRLVSYRHALMLEVEIYLTDKALRVNL